MWNINWYLCNSPSAYYVIRMFNWMLALSLCYSIGWFKFLSVLLYVKSWIRYWFTSSLIQWKMVALKIIHTSFNLLHPFQTRTIQKLYSLPLCRSTSKDSSSAGSQPEGDLKKQELLAKIAMLQTQKLRLTDYLDERSAYLTQFAEEASAEIDAIGENALKDLDEASARVCTSTWNFLIL